MKKLNLVGEKYNRLLVIKEVKKTYGKSRSFWLCECDCGKLSIVVVDKLRSGSTKSCGCLNLENRLCLAKRMNAASIKYSPRESTARKVAKSRYADMPFQDFYEMSQLNCYYCNKEPSNKQNVATSKSSEKFCKEATFIYNGLDRVDNNLGHSKENCVPCCKICNYAKRERSVEDFKSWVLKTYRYYVLNERN